MNKDSKQYKSIGDVTKLLNLFDKKTGKTSTHTIITWPCLDVL